MTAPTPKIIIIGSAFPALGSPGGVVVITAVFVGTIVVVLVTVMVTVGV